MLFFIAELLYVAEVLFGIALHDLFKTLLWAKFVTSFEKCFLYVALYCSHDLFAFYEYALLCNNFFCHHAKVAVTYLSV